MWTIDLISESVRAIVLAGICAYLYLVGKRPFGQSRQGWRLILAGLGLLLFASLWDITDNFPSLNRYVIVGDTEAQACIEKLVGSLGGFVLLSIGLVRWLPTVISQEELRESERRYRLLADNINDVIWTTDLQLRFTYFSPSVELLRGFTAKEAMAQSLEETLTPASAGLARRVLGVEMALAEEHRDFSKRFRTIELEHTCKDGSTAWAEVKASFLCGSKGEPVGLVGVTRDITERKRAEEEIERSEERFRAIFDEAPLGVALIDSLTGHICEVNPRFAEIVGRTREEMASIDWMSITHPDDVQEDLDNMARLNAGKVANFKMNKRYIHPDGSVVWINMTIVHGKGKRSPGDPAGTGGRQTVAPAIRRD